MGQVGFVLYDVKVNGNTVSDFPLDAEMRHGFGKHDMLFLRIVMTRARSRQYLKTAWPDGAAVEVRWGRQPSITTWYGYVSHHNTSTQDDGGNDCNQVTYVCVGTSKPMNTDKSRSWTKVTPTYIAKKIAKEYGMRTVVSSTKWILDYEIQGNESDFKFLSRLANKVGYRFWVSGGTLYFIDPLQLLGGASNYTVPYFSVDKAPGYSDTAANFSVNQGDNLPGAVIAQRQMYGIDPNTHKPFVAKADHSQGPIFDIHSSRNAKSYAEAKKYINAVQSLSQFWVGGTLDVRGNTLLYPGKAIKIGGQALPDNMAGYWIVSGARHQLKRAGVPDPTLDHYVTTLEIITNTKATQPALRGLQVVSPEIIPMQLVGSQWRAGRTNVVSDQVL